MNKIAKIQSVINAKTGRAGLLLRKKSPEILLVCGCVGLVVATVKTYQAVSKAEFVLDTAKDKLDKIKEAKELNNPEVYNDQDYAKDLAITYVQTGVDYVKLFGPPVALGALSVSCIFGSHNIMRKRNIALMAAYRALGETFNTYRGRVIDEFGEDKDRQFRTGVHAETVTFSEVDADGKKIKGKKTVETVNPSEISQYARFFDRNNINWSEDAHTRLTFLKCQQNYANDRLQGTGHVFLNEVYDMLGLKRSTAGAVVGWVKGVGDDFIDFGMFNDNIQAYADEYRNDTIGEERRDFVNGSKDSILLDFNVCGVIYDMI